MLSTAIIFDRLHDRYDNWYLKNRITAMNELSLIKFMISGKPRPCVEIGVGTGYFASAVGCELGIDPSIGMLEKARQRGIESLAGLGERLPLKKSSIATVLMVVTLCFLDFPTKALKEVKEVLVPKGYFIACIVPKDSPWGRLYRRLSLRGHPFYTYAKFYSVKEVIKMAEDVNLVYRRAYATLNYRPWDKVRPETPRPYKGGEGFVCIEFQRRG